MPLKKKKISELEEAQDMRGFYTIGYRIVNGVKTSLKFGLEKVQTAYENMVALKNDALAALLKLPLKVTKKQEKYPKPNGSPLNRFVCRNTAV